RSLLRGPARVIRGCGSRTEEYTAMGDQVRAWLEAGVDPAEIAVAGRNQWVVRNAAKELEARDVRTTTLENTSDHPAVRLGTMHRLQGQEFRCVRSEEHTSELQSRFEIVCRLLLEKKMISQLSTTSAVNALYRTINITKMKGWKMMVGSILKYSGT